MKPIEPPRRGIIGRGVRGVAHVVTVVVGSLLLTLAFFLVLPLIQAIGEKQEDMQRVSQYDMTSEPPPPTPEEEEPEPEPEPEEEPPPPELAEEQQPLDLSMLEMALNPGGLDGGFLAGDFGVDLNVVKSNTSEVDQLFSVSDLDQKPRVIQQPGPRLDARLRSRGGGKVYVIFVVDTQGRVENPVVQRSTDPAFEPAAIAAVKRWKFEPAKRNGEPVRFRMRVPITFPDR